MALPSSGQISLDNILDEKQGSTTARTNVSLRGLSVDGVADSSGGDIAGSPNQSAPHAMSEFHGFSAFSWGSMPTIPQSWGDVSHNSQFTALALAGLGFAFQPANDRVRIRHGNGTGSSALSYAFVSLPYTGSDPASCEFKIAFTAVTSGVTTSSSIFGGITSNVYNSMATQTSTNDAGGSWTSVNTFIQKSSGAGGAALNAIGANSPQFTVRAKDSGGNVIGTSTTSGQNGVSLAITRGSGGGEFVCIHEDHLIETELGPMSVRDVMEKDPKIWTWNVEKQDKELVDQVQTTIVPHSNLYIINDEFKLTDDHVMYGENLEAYAVKPERSLENYNIEAAEIQIGHKLKTFNGDEYVVNSIEKLEGEHITYTTTNANKNFYANGILVDSEI